MNKIKNINICPKCYSSNYYISNDNGLITGQNSMYVCNNCGFRGTIFPQIDSDNLHKLKKTNKAKPIIRKDKQTPKQLMRIFIVLLLITLTYTAYRFGLFDFTSSSHKHAVSFFSKYVHFK